MKNTRESLGRVADVGWNVERDSILEHITHNRCTSQCSGNTVHKLNLHSSLAYSVLRLNLYRAPYIPSTQGNS